MLLWPGLAAVAQALGPGPPAGLQSGAPIGPVVTNTEPAGLEHQVRQFAVQAGAVSGLRLEVQVGALDRRLRLAPCARVEPYLPAGTRLWGKTRIGLRCVEGGTPWNVYLPLTVKAFGRGLTAVAALPVGSVLTLTDLQLAEVDFADAAVPVLNPELAVGRTLARPLVPGQTLHQSDLRVRQWFAAGDTVQITAVGAGFRISGEGQALGPGIEGQPTRVRTDSGRTVIGLPVANRRLEVAL